MQDINGILLLITLEFVDHLGKFIQKYHRVHFGIFQLWDQFPYLSLVVDLVFVDLDSRCGYFFDTIFFSASLYKYLSLLKFTSMCTTQNQLENALIKSIPGFHSFNVFINAHITFRAIDNKVFHE